ncbi:MAG TPA: radical SAM protein [Vicinamibacterales bacterium]|nr:radical SAM protein [Vicinamibacterales bacterium]HPW19842.1 radical SAM protein [Vicinamibacterales bacterium]
MGLAHLATRFTCSWPWSTLVLLCDGRVVCGCADPYAARVVGDARTSTLHEIWTGAPMAALRAGLNGGGAAFCGDCPLKLPLGDGDAPPQRGLDVPPQPSRLYVECTAACNISCFKACCAPETGITRTRQAGMLDAGLFGRVLDEAGPFLGRIDFFNYGEAFLHKRAVEMCERVKRDFPHIYLYTSTNGLALGEESARRLARSGIDEVTFSIDGASQATYERYRRRGRFETAIANLRAMAAEKRAAGRDVPVLNWRYILFEWNDSDEEMQRARDLAAEIGVDRLAWEITDHPEEAFSRRFAPGTAEHQRIRHEIWDTSNLGNAIPGATPRARIEVAPMVPGLPLFARRGRLFAVRTRVHNLSTRPFPREASYGRRLVRLGAQLCDASGIVLDRDHARAWLPRPIGPGEQVAVPIEVLAPPQPGRYQLKFDLVSEGIDWFEACGSDTTLRPLVVL